MSETAPVVEASAEPVAEVANPAPAAVPEPSNSSKLLDLAKKEAKFVAKEVEYKNRLAAAEKELEDLKYFRSAKDVLSKNPEELLQKLGISYDELTKSILDYYDNKEKGAKAPTVEELRAEIAKEFETREKMRVESIQKSAIDSFNNEIKQFVSTNEEKYPHLTKLGTSLGGADSTEDLVFQIVSNYFEETGELLDLETAANTAEEYFAEEWNKLNGVLSGKKSAPPVEDASPAKVEELANSGRGFNPSAHPDNIIRNEELPVANTTSYKRFKEVVNTAPTINNTMPVKTAAPFRERRLERDELIAKAVSAYENVARTKR